MTDYSSSVKSNRQRVLICRSNPIAPDPRLEKVALTLSGAGYVVKLLGWDRTGELPESEQVAGVDCYRLRIMAAFGSGMGNFGPLMRWQWGLLRWMIRNKDEFDLIHACDFDTVLPALFCKWIFGKKVIYDIFDFYADHLRATPKWVKGLIRAADRWAIQKVNGLILTDEARLEQIGNIRPAHWTVIYNTPQDLKENIKTQVSPQTSTVLRLVYVGLLQVERGLLDVLSILKDHPNLQLDLAGFGGDEKYILDQAQEMPNVHWHGRIAYPQALELTSAADVVLALYDPALPNHRYASPSKLFEALMFGKSVIVARDTHIDEIVSQEECGLVVTYGDRNDLEKALVKLQQDDHFRQQLGENGRRAYEQRYNWGKMETRLLQLYAHFG